MLRCKRLSHFENPSRQMYLEAAGGERWTDASSGKATTHALEYAKNTPTQRDKLATDVASAIPPKIALNMPGYTAKSGDSVTKVLLDKVPAAQLSTSKLMLLAYRYMLSQPSGKEINSLFPGDTMTVVGGKLTITRAASSVASGFSNVSVDIFPYLPDAKTATPPAVPGAPAQNPPPVPAAPGSKTAPDAAPSLPPTTPAQNPPPVPAAPGSKTVTDGAPSATPTAPAQNPPPVPAAPVTPATPPRDTTPPAAPTTKPAPRRGE